MHTPYKVLLVDNDAVILKLIDRTLTDAGYSVLSTSDPYHARRVLEDPQVTVHLLLTDVFMPEISGPELARGALGARSGLRVLFMSGNPRGRSPFRKGDQLISKPFAIGELLQRVRKILTETDWGVAREEGVTEEEWTGLERRRQLGQSTGSA